MSGNPLTQFEVKELFNIGPVFGHFLSVTNSSIFMILAFISSVAFFYFGTRKLEIKPVTHMQVAFESLYGFIMSMMRQSVSNAEVIRFFPLVFTIFMFVISCNLLGMLPYGFTVTSHVIVTFAMGISILLLITIYGIWRNGLGFFHIFLPSGVPLWLSPLVVFIETFAYLARSMTLALRLSANMIAGHTMLKVIATLTLGAGLFSLLPFTFIIAITAFEFFVASLQAYIFATLVCVYLNDIFSVH